jgi:hypothetical protein
MFVRWKRVQGYRRVAYDFIEWHGVRVPRRIARDEYEPTGVWTRYAYLIKAYRTEEGPRQRYISRLGSIVEGQESDPDARARFWKDVEAGLSEAESTMGFRVGWDFIFGPDGTIQEVDRIEPFTFTAADRVRIVAALAAVVPRPDPPRCRGRRTKAEEG